MAERGRLIITELEQQYWKLRVKAIDFRRRARRMEEGYWKTYLLRFEAGHIDMEADQLRRTLRTDGIWISPLPLDSC